MKPSGSLGVPLVFFGFALVFSLQVLPSISRNSLTNDETTDITNGYYYLTKGDVVSPHNHPPVGSALQAVPLLFLPLKTAPLAGDVIDRGHAFLFEWNLDKLMEISRFSRMVSWLVGCLLGLCLWRVTKNNLAILAFTLFFWAFDPLLLALSGLAKTDIVPTFFFFLAVWTFQKSLEKPTATSSLSAGLMTGLAVLSKFYCLALIPVFVILEWMKIKHLNLKNFPKDKFRELRNRWLVGLVGFTFISFLVYLPGTLLLPDHQEPFHYLFFKLWENLAFARQTLPVYFLGQCGLENHWYYLPVAFLLKEPMPFLLLTGLSVVLAAREKIIIPAWQWISPLIFSLAVLPAPNLGVRYLLPAFPFLFLMAGQSAAWLWNKSALSKRGLGPLAIGSLVLWQSASVLLNFPHTLGYFNDLIPVDKKIYFLGDSNLDWGQDIQRLAETAKLKQWGTVKLAYYGGVDPKVYGLDWKPWREQDLKGPQPGTVYVVNAGFFQLAPAAFPPAKTIAESWISRQTPTGKVGDSFYYFDIPGKTPIEPKGPFLVSVPFQQVRGYTPWTPATR